MAIPRVLLAVVLCRASAGGPADPCSTYSPPTTSGPAPLVPVIAPPATPPGASPCATPPPGKQIGIDIGIGLGSAAVAGAVGGLVWVAHDSMTTQAVPTPPLPPMGPVNFNATQMQKLSYSITNKTKVVMDADAEKMAGGLGLFMIAGGVCLFCALSSILAAGFKKTRSTVKKEADGEKKSMKKIKKKVEEEEMMANPLLRAEKDKKKQQKKQDKPSKKNKGGSSGSDSGSSSSSSSSSSSDHSDDDNDVERGWF